MSGLAPGDEIVKLRQHIAQLEACIHRIRSARGQSVSIDMRLYDDMDKIRLLNQIDQIGLEMDEKTSRIAQLETENSTIRKENKGLAMHIEQLEAEKTVKIDVVFDGSSSPGCGRFVECERQDGRSVNAGEWIHHDDGYWVLRIDVYESSLNQHPPPAESNTTATKTGSISNSLVDEPSSISSSD